MKTVRFWPTPDRGGLGLFANQSFLPGETLGYYEADSNSVYVNNSHDPNAEMVFDREQHLWYLRAIKVIKRGKEITIQYQHPAPIPERCLCKAKNCSGWIGVK